MLSARLGGERRDRAGDDGDGGAGAAVASALMMTSTGGVFLVLAIASSHPIIPSSIPAGAWPGIVGIGLFSTFIAIQTFYGGARRIGAAPAALISTIEPAYTIVMAALWPNRRRNPTKANLLRRSSRCDAMARQNRLFRQKFLRT